MLLVEFTKAGLNGKQKETKEFIGIVLRLPVRCARVWDREKEVQHRGEPGRYCALADTRL